MTGNNMRERTESMDNEISLGSNSVITGPFGASVIFSCTYPMSIDVKQDFTVAGASVVHTMTGTGSLAAGFTMILNNGGPVHFQLGTNLPVAVTWSVTGLAKLTYYLHECGVVHGASTITVIKEGCYSNALDVVPDAGHQGFTYQIFKAMGETALDQTIECSVRICEVDKCTNPTADNQCPATGEDEFYEFKV